MSIKVICTFKSFYLITWSSGNLSNLCVLYNIYADIAWTHNSCQSHFRSHSFMPSSPPSSSLVTRQQTVHSTNFALLHCTTLHCHTLPCSELPWIAMPCNEVNCPALHWPTLQCTALNCTALRCSSPLHSPTLKCTAHHCTELHFPTHSFTDLHWTTLPCSAMNFTELFFHNALYEKKIFLYENIHFLHWNFF